MFKNLHSFYKHTVYTILIVIIFLLSGIYVAYADEEDISSEVVEDTTLKVNDLDLGNYETRMYVGTRQLLNVTALPLGVEENPIYYTSSDENVATINGMGRIVAVSSGTCEISVMCNTVVRGFTLKVVQEEVKEVKDIDIGKYKDNMLVGEHQVLNVTPIPTDAENSYIEYFSSNNDVVTVNALGRIIAKEKGSTTITIKCGTIERNFILRVTEEEKIEVSDIDLGVYSDEMTVGDTQMLSITIIPTNATDPQIKYSSSDNKVAKVNDIGRVFAIGKGKCKITVSCGRKKKNFNLTVKEKVVVTDIEIGKYEDKLEVDERMTLKVKALPEDAEDRKITFSSSDTNIAKVSSDGEVLGLSKGRVIITIRAGDIEKEIELSIIIPTSRIEVNSTYLIMKKGDSFQIESEVYPKEAEQVLTYKTANSKIASVSDRGKVCAKGLGNTSIIVSNGDLSKVITVIVNEQGSSIDSTPNFLSQNKNKAAVELSAFEKRIVEQLDYHSEIEIMSEECPLLTKSILKKILETHSILKVVSPEYTIMIEGKEILNYENELRTDIHLTSRNNTTEFIINEKQKIPGSIEIYFPEEYTLYKYLYLYNEEKDKFQLLDNKDIVSGKIKIDVAGRYILTNEKIDTFVISQKSIIIGGAVIVIVTIIYCILKKRYWLW